MLFSPLSGESDPYVRSPRASIVQCRGPDELVGSWIFRGIRDRDLGGVDWNRMAFEKVDICQKKRLASCRVEIWAESMRK